MDKGTAREGFFAHYDGTGNSEATICESVTTKCVLEYDLVQLVQDHGGKPLNGPPLGRLPELWPFDLLKDELLKHAEEFIRQIKTQGFNPLTSKYEFQVWGPYSEKVGAVREWTPEAGNPFAEQREALQVWSYQGDEFDWSKGCAFLIKGNFTRYAGLGQVDEETGVLLV